MDLLLALPYNFFWVYHWRLATKHPLLDQIADAVVASQIAEAADAFLVMDMAHINRLVAASVVTDPFEYRGYINSRQVMGLPFEIIMYL